MSFVGNIFINRSGSANLDVDPLLHADGLHLRTGSPCIDAGVDSDGDWLTNGEEYRYGTDPAALDSDGDGTGDGDEVAFGSHPADAGDLGDPANCVPVELTVGDWSGSESERYELVLTGGGATLRHQAPDFGVVASESYPLVRGTAYRYEVRWLGTQEGQYDYDYRARIAGVPLSSGGSHAEWLSPGDGILIHDPSRLLGDHENQGPTEPGGFSRAGQTGMVYILKVELKVTHPQNPGPTGSAAKYNNSPNTGSADNLFSTWLNEQFRVNVNIQPTELANNLPAGFVKWTAAGFTIPDNTTEYTFSWSSTALKEITVEFPSCGLTKKVRVDVPDVGILSQTAAAALVGAPSVFVLAYAQEAIDYSNNNFPVGPQRDAFRHAYWMSLSVSQVGVAQWEALLISTGHEHDNRGDEPHQQAFNSTMDLHNNAVGSTISHTTLLGLPDRTPIQNDITQQYTNGGLWIWAGGGAQENSEGILVKSNGTIIYSD